MIPIIPKYAKLGEGFSKQELADAGEHPGRQTKVSGYQSASTWVTALVDLRKPVILCSFCFHKFNPKKARYRRFYCLNANGENGYRTDGRCDDCKEDTRRTPSGGTMMIPEETYSQICTEPGSRRSVRARVNFRGQTIWGAVQQSIKEFKKWAS